MKIIRPELKESTVKRLRKQGNYPKNVSLDYIINDILNRLGEKKT